MQLYKVEIVQDNYIIAYFLNVFSGLAQQEISIGNFYRRVEILEYVSKSSSSFDVVHQWQCLLPLIKHRQHFLYDLIFYVRIV